MSWASYDTGVIYVKSVTGVMYGTGVMCFTCIIFVIGLMSDIGVIYVKSVMHVTSVRCFTCVINIKIGLYNTCVIYVSGIMSVESVIYVTGINYLIGIM